MEMKSYVNDGNPSVLYILEAYIIFSERYPAHSRNSGMALTPQALAGLRDWMTQVVWGGFIGPFFSGVFVTLGISCIFLLARGKKTSKQHHFLCIYIIALLFLVIVYEVEMFLEADVVPILSLQSLREAQEFSDTAMALLPLTQTTIYALTEGLLVWRCFKIYRGVRRNLLERCGHIVWIFPACLLGLGLVTGFISGGLGFHLSATLVLHQSTLGRILGATALTSQIILNLYATALITLTLLAYRRMVKRYSGNTASNDQHLPGVIAILLESAAINVPITIITAVGIGGGEKFGILIAPTATVSQALASVLIIHQVALGRAFDHGVERATPMVQGHEGNEQELSDHGV
ncbi:hypothetical protein P691DRAFT_765031 [Macrolepiota fuliginosa MF-IS2]|uniref:G protein-coupled receptor n=1 Tax=Macrolepiota fuliginosa MF-IS2 TaxID=1400762 RepID=A0A9P5X3D2_9AGAR|nr:hypothetical protein P691DRAFT_765031 [Macrolepiota fuliginosa MF-IS2]